MTYSSLNAYKQQILNDFNSRLNYETEFHKRAATRLVDLAKLQSGQHVIDIATGTGLAAIAAAMVVGSTGRVLGTDFALGMLQQAQQKVEVLGLTNIKFEEADADEQELQESQFDAILCSSAIVYLTDIPTSLRRWHNALKPGGVVAFSCLAETSPTAAVLFRTVVQRYGITIANPNKLLGTPKRCCQLLETIGFEEIEITTEQFGFYLQDASGAWAGNARSAFGLQDVKWSKEQLEQCKQEYFTEINKASTEEGYWNDTTMFFVRARKSSGTVA
ncbi:MULTISPECIES: class I SAM-dependent methyltransferase [Nostoc]|uniref:Class I SAM-dependent methyltransferase n=1 Tax=Nostoc paludosum FACHB-159 TaxID=2692908 RepID=A0ABR8KAI7_9NOSO|nr:MULTISPECIES: class I SAM-dependent methyltransferase [Nostoc]MBD2676648.1 class I SAM-dependent methyltransferase [Nostoc sp. FACHB-857]MBD2735127.1 class I SAM-dependent methyltransferase [Nostoc paludosum FACHB-159]